MTTFVLLPGAGGAAWVWHRVVPLLTRAGFSAVAVDLPADDPNAGLEAYADRVIAAIDRPRDSGGTTPGPARRGSPAPSEAATARSSISGPTSSTISPRTSSPRSASTNDRKRTSPSANRVASSGGRPAGVAERLVAYARALPAVTAP